jgi:DNA ligase (NAD+)
VWIERLNEAGILERPSDFYALTRDRLLEFERIADISADRMIESIERSKPVGLRRALIGLAIPMASEATATRLCRAGYSSLEEVAAADEEALQQLEDIGPKVATSLREHLNRESTRDELKRLRELGVDLDVRAEDLPPKVAADAPLAGKTVVVTGTIADPRSGEKIPRPTFQRLCERAGATTASSVSANTDMLITGENVGAAKTAKASKLDVQVVDQGEIWTLLIDAGVA